MEALYDLVQNNLMSYIAVMIAILVILLALLIYAGWRKQKQFNARMQVLTEGKEELTASEFLEAARARSGHDFTGAYVLHNATKGMYYVGQAKSVMKRVTQHLTGHGNGDVYADYKYGDEFKVKTLPLSQSGYDSLNALERDLITHYDAFNNGYNSTHGNRN